MLYDSIKSQPVTKVADDLQAGDIKAFCDAHDVEFFAMGTPPGVGGTGWDDPAVFRVGTRPGMFGGAPRGRTISLDAVRSWKQTQTETSASL